MIGTPPCRPKARRRSACPRGAASDGTRAKLRTSVDEAGRSVAAWYSRQYAWCVTSLRAWAQGNPGRLRATKNLSDDYGRRRGDPGQAASPTPPRTAGQASCFTRDPAKGGSLKTRYPYFVFHITEYKPYSQILCGFLFNAFSF